MKRLRPLLAALTLTLLLVGAGVRAVWDAGWSPDLYNGRCWSNFCIVTGYDGTPYFEASWAEYLPPLPATVPAQGAPSWGGPPTQGSTSARRTSP